MIKEFSIFRLVANSIATIIFVAPITFINEYGYLNYKDVSGLASKNILFVIATILVIINLLINAYQLKTKDKKFTEISMYFGLILPLIIFGIGVAFGSSVSGYYGYDAVNYGMHEDLYTANIVILIISDLICIAQFIFERKAAKIVTVENSTVNKEGTKENLEYYKKLLDDSLITQEQYNTKVNEILKIKNDNSVN